MQLIVTLILVFSTTCSAAVMFVRDGDNLIINIQNEIEFEIANGSNFSPSSSVSIILQSDFQVFGTGGYLIQYGLPTEPTISVIDGSSQATPQSAGFGIFGIGDRDDLVLSFYASPQFSLELGDTAVLSVGDIVIRNFFSSSIIGDEFAESAETAMLVWGGGWSNRTSTLVPEPSTTFCVALGLCGIILLRRRVIQVEH